MEAPYITIHWKSDENSEEKQIVFQNVECCNGILFGKNIPKAFLKSR